MWKIPVGVALIVLLLSALGGYLFRLTPPVFAVVVSLTPLIVAAFVWAVAHLRQILHDNKRTLETLRKDLETLELSVSTIGAIAHVVSMRHTVKEIIRVRETIIGTTPTGEDLTTMQQLLTRATPGEPITDFPAIIGTPLYRNRTVR
jgi:hypothetical protein